MDVTSRLPEINMDLAYPSEADGTGGTIILKVRERNTHMTMPSTFPSKSSSVVIEKRTPALMREAGCEQEHIAIESGQEATRGRERRREEEGWSSSRAPSARARAAMGS